jgi:hypothetical protein
MIDGFVKPSEWLDWFNFERKALQISILKYGALLNDLTLTSSVGSPVITIDSDILAIVGLWELTSSGKLRPIRIVNLPDNFRQLPASLPGLIGGRITGPAEYATIEDGILNGPAFTTVTMFPVDLSGTYVLVTLKSPTDATSNNESFAFPMGLEERIVLGMAKRAKIKEESDYSDIDDLIRQADRQVEDYAWSRIFAQAPSVRNVDLRERGWLGELNTITPDHWIWR